MFVSTSGLNSALAHNVTVHRAAANDIDFISRATRGSVCNGLLSSSLAVPVLKLTVFVHLPAEVLPVFLRGQQEVSKGVGLGVTLRFSAGQVYAKHVKQRKEMRPVHKHPVVATI